MSTALNISLDFIKHLKQQIVSSRYVVAKIANAESLRLYFAIGETIDQEIKKQNWGVSALNFISLRLHEELPGLRGFSSSNLKKMRLFYNAWKETNLIGSLATNQWGWPYLKQLKPYLRNIERLCLGLKNLND